MNKTRKSCATFESPSQCESSEHGLQCAWNSAECRDGTLPCNESETGDACKSHGCAYTIAGTAGCVDTISCDSIQNLSSEKDCRHTEETCHFDGATWKMEHSSEISYSFYTKRLFAKTWTIKTLTAASGVVKSVLSSLFRATESSLKKTARTSLWSASGDSEAALLRIAVKPWGIRRPKTTVEMSVTVPSRWSQVSQSTKGGMSDALDKCRCENEDYLRSWFEEGCTAIPVDCLSISDQQTWGRREYCVWIAGACNEKVHANQSANENVEKCRAHCWFCGRRCLCDYNRVGVCGDVCLHKKRTSEQDDSTIAETRDIELEIGTSQTSKRQESSSKAIQFHRPKRRKKETRFSAIQKTVDTKLTALRMINSDGVLSTEKCQVSSSSPEQYLVMFVLFSHDFMMQ